MPRIKTHRLHPACLAVLLAVPAVAPAWSQADSTPPGRLRLPQFSSLESGETGSAPAGTGLRGDAAQFGYTSRFLFRRIFHPSNRAATWLSVGGILGASAVLEHNKRDVQEDLLDYSTEESNEIFATSKILGNAGVVPGIGLLLFLEGKIFKQPQAHEAGLMVMESAVYTAVFTELGRFILAEQRPDEGGDLQFFKSGGHGISGHASIAASIAAPLSRGLFRVDAEDGRWARFGKHFGTGVAYGLPVLTGLSRIEDNRHYAWNVVLGLALGFSVGETVADAHDAFSEEGGDRRWKPDSIGPLLSDQGRGLALHWRF